ncbi:Protein T28F3.4 a [Aphelenchoides avenae]|nr:Protein T28F3.4 a [Aphelenchus avenae]
MCTSNPKSAKRVPLLALGSIRVHVALLLMMGLFCSTSMRMNLGMAMVCMVNTTAFDAPEGPLAISTESLEIPLNSQCRRLNESSAAAADRGYHGTLLWGPKMQSLLFSATFYGSLLTIWCSGYLADRFGPKMLFLLAILDYTLVSLLSPFLATSNFYVFFVARVVMGIGEGFISPTMSSSAARWFTPVERSRMAALYTSGNQLAAIFGMLISSRLCGMEFLGGWPAIFYMFGIVGAVWSVLWCVFVSDAPEDNRWISEAEKKYIIDATASQRSTTNGSKKLANGPVPWRNLLTSLPLYADILAQMSFNFTATIVQSYLPTYFKEVLHLDLAQNGFFSIIPFVTQLISKNIAGWLSDLLKRRGILSGTSACKIFQGIGNFGSALCFLALGIFVTCDRLYLAVTLLAVFGFCFSCGISGFYTSVLSLAPPYTGTSLSMCTTFGVIANALAPNIVAFLKADGTPAEWTSIWCVIAAVNVAAGGFFMIFASGTLP